MIAMRPPAARWGWAFESVGAPCVAQRVWPIATVPSGSGRSASSCARTASFPALLAIARRVVSGVTTAMPAESYPRYSSLASPAITTSWGRELGAPEPTYPTMPHMGTSLVREKGPAARSDPRRKRMRHNGNMDEATPVDAGGPFVTFTRAEWFALAGKTPLPLTEHD